MLLPGLLPVVVVEGDVAVLGCSQGADFGCGACCLTAVLACCLTAGVAWDCWGFGCRFGACCVDLDFVTLFCRDAQRFDGVDFAAALRARARRRNSRAR